MLFRKVRQLVAVAIALYFLTLCVASCGRAPTVPEMERACRMVVTDTLWLEPGHVIGGFVLESSCTK